MVVIKRVTLLGALALPVCTQANGAMGLGLEMFLLSYWLVYVAAMVVFEAWWLGKRRGFRWWPSLGLSTIANLISALLCPALLAPLLHYPVVGSASDPKPLLNAVALFIGFGLVSALIECGVWGLVDKKWSLLWRSVQAHMIGVPIGLAILLIPAEPYKGLQFSDSLQRRHGLERWAQTDLQEAILEQGTLPSLKSVEEAIRMTGRPDIANYAYYPRFSRFAMGIERGYPYEWNRALNGRKIGEGAREWVWLIRPPKGVWQRVIEVNLGGGDIRVRNPEHNP